jgi:hypothetical protein
LEVLGRLVRKQHSDIKGIHDDAKAGRQQVKAPVRF